MIGVFLAAASGMSMLAFATRRHAWSPPWASGVGVKQWRLAASLCLLVSVGMAVIGYGPAEGIVLALMAAGVAGSVLAFALANHAHWARRALGPLLIGLVALVSARLLSLM